METKSYDFYQRHDTGEILLIEMDWQGNITRASGPLEPPLQAPDAYELNTDRNTELRAVNDKLILLS